MKSSRPSERRGNNDARSGPGEGSRSTQDKARTPPMETPGTDIQGEDTGTAASGGSAGPGTASEGAMKQTSKTDKERGSGG